MAGRGGVGERKEGCRIDQLREVELFVIGAEEPGGGPRDYCFFPYVAIYANSDYPLSE